MIVINVGTLAQFPPPAGDEERYHAVDAQLNVTRAYVLKFDSSKNVSRVWRWEPNPLPNPLPTEADVVNSQRVERLIWV